MAKFNKLQDGLIYYDNFTEQSLMWTLSPSDSNCVRFGEGGLTILHNRRYVTFTIVEPAAEEFSCIVELDHIPVNFEDIGGIVIIANNKEYAECQSFLATGPSEIGNSNLINADIKALIKETMHSNYVQYSLDDDEVIDTGDDEDATPEEENNNSTPDVSEEPEVEFVDIRYRFIKFTKLKYKYLFWASADGLTWIEIGNVKFESSGSVGFFLYGTSDADIINNSHFVVKSIAMYSSKYINIDGINRSYDFELYDEDGNTILRTDSLAYYHLISRSNASCLVNTTTFPMPLKNAVLRIYPRGKYNETIETYGLGSSVYGGDAFSLEYDIRFMIGNTELDPYIIYDLGTLYTRDRYVIMTVTNREAITLTHLKLRIAKYSEYYGGETFIGLAFDDPNLIESELKYRKELLIPKLDPQESINVFVKLTEKPVQDFYLTAHDYRFKIIIE